MFHKQHIFHPFYFLKGECIQHVAFIFCGFHNSLNSDRPAVCIHFLFGLLLWNNKKWKPNPWVKSLFFVFCACPAASHILLNPFFDGGLLTWLVIIIFSTIHLSRMQMARSWKKSMVIDASLLNPWPVWPQKNKDRKICAWLSSF